MCRKCHTEYKATWLERASSIERDEGMWALSDGWLDEELKWGGRCLLQCTTDTPRLPLQVTFRKVRRKSKFVQVGIEYTYGQLYGARGGAVGWGTSLQVGRSRVRYPVVLGSTEPRTNEYQEYFQGCKGGRCVGLRNLPPRVLTLEILEPSALWNPQGPPRPVAFPSPLWSAVYVQGSSV